MVNEERLQHMIQISRFDTYNGRDCKPMTQYARRDYVSLELLKSFITGTIAYCLVLCLWGLYCMQHFMEQINQMDMKDFVMKLLISYGVFLLVYLVVTYIVYQIKYTEGRRRVKQYYGNIKKVNQIYEREERLKTPGSREWN